MSTPSAIDMTEVSAVAKSSRPLRGADGLGEADEAGGTGHQQPERRGGR